jgi:hypothetical protein
MSKTKYTQVYKEMLESNYELFSEFRKVHDNFKANPIKHRDEFNQVGAKVVEVIRKYENILCNGSESSGYGMYTSKLAETFWNKIRSEFSEIDEVGIT